MNQQEWEASIAWSKVVAGCVIRNVEDNDLTGGTYSLYVRLQGAGSAVANVKVRNNRWHTPHIYGTQSIVPSSAVTEWTGNTVDGKLLAL